MRWFRMYSEVRKDPKIQTLSGNLVKMWLNLMCFACEHEGYLPSAKEIAWELRAAQPKVEGELDDLIVARLIEPRAEGYYMHNWNVRQFQSDTSTKRVKEHREKLRETLLQQEGNVSDGVSCNGAGNVSVTADSSVICNLSSTREETTIKHTERRNVSGNVSGNVSPLDLEIDQIAQRMHDRHPQERRCSVAMIKIKLRQIAKKVPAAERIERVQAIDAKHIGWCAYWATKDPEYVKALENWLAPTMGRFDEEPPTLTRAAAPQRFMI